MSQKRRALIISCFDTWYYNRIGPIAEILEEQGYMVKILVSDYHHIKKEYIMNKNDKCTYIHVPDYKNNLSVTRIVSHFIFGAKVHRYLKSYSPNLLYLLVPPNNTAVYCNRYKKNNSDCIYIVDVIDLWPESMPLGKLKHSLPAWVWAGFRNDSLKSANHVFTECNLYQRKLRGVINPSKASTLYLYKEQSEEEYELVRKIIAEKESQAMIAMHKKRKFAYLGSINHIVDINSICDVLSSFQKNGIQPVMEVIGDGESRKEFLDKLRETGAKVYYHGAIYDEIEKIKILAPCDYGFNMLRDTSEVGLSIKSIDYLSYGLPLINNIKGDTWKMVEKEHIGVNYKKNVDLIEMNTVNHFNVLNCFADKFTRKAFVKRVKHVLSAIS